MSQQKTITDLRNIMFDTLKALQDTENPMEIERALAIKDVGQVIVNSAKVEIDYLKINGSALSSGFIADSQPTQTALPREHTEKTGSGTKTVTQMPNGATITRHKMGA